MDYQADPRTVSSRSVPVLRWLRSSGMDDDSIENLTAMVPTWAALTALPMTTWVSVAGQHASCMVLPSLPPAPSPLPAGVHVYPRHGADYPAGVSRLRHPPALLYVAGDLPDVPAVSVVCGAYPTARGIEVVTDGVRACAASGLVPVLRLGTAAGRAGMVAAGQMGAPVVLVASQGADVFDADARHVDEVLSAGGAWVSACEPAARSHPHSEQVADAVAVALSEAVLVAQAGLSPQEGSAGVVAAIQMSLPLVVPASSPGAFGSVPASLVSDMLAEPGSFAPDVLGSNATIAARSAAGMPAADAVVASQQDLARALADAVARG